MSALQLNLANEMAKKNFFRKGYEVSDDYFTDIDVYQKGHYTCVVLWKNKDKLVGFSKFNPNDAEYRANLGLRVAIKRALDSDLEE